ncbi:MAG: putrescine aminotransferase [Actinobacteria bacterium]|nr:putrescine aminotransferase [Actinomycetota bacterium]
MNDDRRQEALAESQKALDLIGRQELDAAEQDALVAECVADFEAYVNPGILDWRKSVSTDYAAVEWRDEGSCFYDVHGNEFIDCLGGFGIYMLGHRHPTVVGAVVDQLRKQALHSQELLDPLRAYACKLVAMVTPGDLRYSFLCNSGTEATEGSLKVAKLFAFQKKRNHSKGIISTTKAFHGKSLGSLSVSGNSEFREPFTPLVPGARFVPYGDADALDRELKACDMIGFDIAAFIAEPVQGEAGAIVPPDDYFPKVREICDKWDILFIADEVQTGMGRTGAFWGIDNWGVTPDIMGMGKAFGGGVIPAGNICVTPRVFECMFENPYLHTTTFGGNPVATAAAIAAIHVTLAEDIPGQAAEKGAHLKSKVEELAAAYPDLYDDVRGIGLLIGMEFTDAEIGYAVTTGLFAEKVLVGGTLNNAKAFRLEPPAIITYEQLDQVVERLERVLANVRTQVSAGGPAAAH